MSKKEESKDVMLGLLILDEVEKMHDGVLRSCEAYVKEFEGNSIPLTVLKLIQDKQIRIYRESYKKGNK